uniref:non-specific serine/threonine protein kinase n=1 Tax=Monopterus albus TaxID=43700 RepID=A0A3Q3R6J2_MONAL
MESVGKFEFNRKHLIGHGAFAVVFKGRHKEKRDWEVAVKCISKKNLAKSQSLLSKEIKILKELQHENIVRLLDYQVTSDLLFLCLQYCNGGDLAEYLHSKGTLSEDTIRVFLQQIAQAMKVLRGKDILHRDLKPQNILLCHPEGCRSSSINTCIKIADFGFARHLQANTMAATLCGSPMYMAPEVIMSQNYDAKADLWSIGTIAYQCLTGKAPFHVSVHLNRKSLYFSSIPKETSSCLRHLLLGLLQRNHKERMSFDEFFHHPFLEMSCPQSSSTKTCMCCCLFTTPSDGEMPRLQPKMQYSPIQDTHSFLLKEMASQDRSNPSSYTEDYVIVPAQFPSEYTCEVDVGSPIESCLIYSGKPVEFTDHNRSHSVPIPVPSQIQNYHRLEQNLQPFGLHGSTRHVQLLLSLLGCHIPPSPSLAFLIFFCLCLTVLYCMSFRVILSPPTGCRRGSQCSYSPHPAFFIMGSPTKGNTPPDNMLSRKFSGSPSSINSAWLPNSHVLQIGSRRNSETDVMDAAPHNILIFHPPELSEDTLMEQAHTDALNDLRFTLAFVSCVMELASSKDPVLDTISSADVSFLEQSVVKDQISVLRREWSLAEQLILYMKAEEFLSSALHTAKENIKQGQLLPSATVKQVIKKLNDLYKNCVTYCRSLSDQLQTFLLDKQKLMDHFNGLTAEKLIYSHTVQMVQSAALDEMFHYGTPSVQRYYKALLLMEGLSRIITEQKDIDNIAKCKQCIERRLSALQT